jgi:hypothetical protein
MICESGYTVRYALHVCSVLSVQTVLYVADVIAAIHVPYFTGDNARPKIFDIPFDCI